MFRIGISKTSIVVIISIIAIVSLCSCFIALTYANPLQNSATTIHSVTNINMSMYRNLVDRVKYLEERGYDTIYVQYLLLSAKYYYEKGDIDRALEILNKAIDELNRVELRPSLPQLNFTIARSTLYIDDIPSTWDFVPIGTVFALSKRGYLVYPRNDPKWKLSCFIILAIGHNREGEWFSYQGRLPLKPREGVFKPRVFIDNEWRILDIAFAGPLYYDYGEKFGYPTVYQYDLSGRILQYVMYIPRNRTWIHKIIDLESNRTLLEIRAKAIGVPMWIGRWNETYLVHGVYAREKGLDIWSGFWDIALMNATIRIDDTEKKFRGIFIFDRASHRVYYIKNAFMPLGLPLAFSCMVIYQENIVIAIANSVNPSPWDTGYSF
ncbi:MAG TPA: hypothetical protein ENF93_00685, partial [Ignisphaera sp.]|nr:hypothetical protein [Ignisphaera sp.]